MKRLIAILAVGFILGLWIYLKSKESSCSTEWFGATDEAMLQKVKQDIQRAEIFGCEALKASLFSGGGPVTTSVEISHEIKRARARGLRVEIAGRSFIASGGTIVLASGTPGYRTISSNAAVLVHGLQITEGWFSRSCADLVENAETEKDKWLNATIHQVAREYSDSTKVPVWITQQWLKCGNEQAGDGKLLVELGIADKVI